MRLGEEWVISYPVKQTGAIVTREIFEQQYKRAAAEGALVELRLRLLADKVPQLQSIAHDEKLWKVENLIAQHFANALTDEEKEALGLCRELRNKVLHCDFRAARGKLEQLGADAQRGNTKRVALHGLLGTQMAEKIARVEAGDATAFEYVANSQGPGTVFAWLIEAGAAGDFNQAANAFARASEILHRLACI
jgi:hypothetical protein